MITDIVALMARQGGVVSAGQLRSCGLTYDQIHALVRRGSICVLRRAIFTTPELLDSEPASAHRVEIAGALLARQVPVLLDPRAPAPVDFAAGGLSAALLWGLPAALPQLLVSAGLTGDGPAPDGRARRMIELVSADRCRRSHRHGVRVRPAALPADQVAVVDGLPVTTLSRSTADLLRTRPWHEAVAVADAALRGGLDRAALDAALDAAATWSGSREAARAAAFANPLAESPAESLARCVLAEVGLPTPELQVELYDTDGLIGRVDLLFRVERTVVEVDGKVKYTGPEVLWREKRREDRLREAGWEVVRVTWAELTGAPERVAARIRSAFARASARRSA